MLPDLQVIFFFYSIVKSLKKIFIHRLGIGCIIIYHTTIILNAQDRVASYIKLKVVKD